MGKGENDGPCKVLDLLFLPFTVLPLSPPRWYGWSLSSYMDEKKNPLSLWLHRPNNIPSNHFFRKVSQMEKENWERKEEKGDDDSLRRGYSRKWDVEAWMVPLYKKSRKANEISLLLSLSFGAFQFLRWKESASSLLYLLYLLYRWSPLAMLHVCRYDCEAHTYDCSFSLLMIMVNYTTFVTVDMMWLTKTETLHDRGIHMRRHVLVILSLKAANACVLVVSLFSLLIPFKSLVSPKHVYIWLHFPSSPTSVEMMETQIVQTFMHRFMHTYFTCFMYRSYVVNLICPFTVLGTRDSLPSSFHVMSREKKISLHFTSWTFSYLRRKENYTQMDSCALLDPFFSRLSCVISLCLLCLVGSHVWVCIPFVSGNRFNPSLPSSFIPPPVSLFQE